MYDNSTRTVTTSELKSTTIHNVFHGLVAYDTVNISDFCLSHNYRLCSSYSLSQVTRGTITSLLVQNTGKSLGHNFLLLIALYCFFNCFKSLGRQPKEIRVHVDRSQPKSAAFLIETHT